MEKRALIHVLSSQPENDEKEDSIEVVTPGSFYKKDNDYYAVYEETEISGMEGTTTTLKIGENNFSLIRMGSTTTKMEFEKDKEKISMYSTPYGTLEINILTKELKINVDDTGGEVFINYDMGISGEDTQHINLDIKIKPQ